MRTFCNTIEALYTKRYIHIAEVVYSVVKMQKRTYIMRKHAYAVNLYDLSAAIVTGSKKIQKCYKAEKLRIEESLNWLALFSDGN